MSFGGGNLLNAEGKATTNCSLASSFSLNEDGSLTLSTDKNSALSADFGDKSILLAPYKPAKDIKSKWQFRDGRLTWINRSFLQGEAIFCQEGRGVAAYLQTRPENCRKTDLLSQDGQLSL